MTETLYSNWWYRVSARRPKLRSHVRIHRHRYRGEVWYLLQSGTSSRVHRFTPATRLIIALMDGRRTVAELWDIAREQLGDDAPTQDEMIELLGQLHGADLLQSDVTPDTAELAARNEREAKAKSRRSYANPMAIRIPLVDPNAMLDRLGGLNRLMWGRVGALLWLLVVVPAVMLVGPHWQDLSGNFTDRVLAVDNLLILYLVFPVVKALHELGHATATKAGGGEVHDMGVVLLALLPVPYVEASAATVFVSKYQRAMVGAAGVVVELFLAAIAFYVWLLVEPGVVRAALFNVMLIAGVSTLLFNGNPLLRYDAYYVLADLIEIPNLAQRSARYWGYLLERYVLGVTEVAEQDASAYEKAWFLFYGLASSLYRIFVTVLIALFIASRFFFIGVILAVWAVAAMVVGPLMRAVRHVAGNPAIHRHRTRAGVTVTALLLAFSGLLLALPVRQHSFAEGVLWLPDEALVRVRANCFFTDFLREPGSAVAKGEAIARCHDPVATAALRQGEARVDELQAERDAQFVTDRAKAQITAERLQAARAAVDLARQRLGDLVMHAQMDGIFSVPQMGDMPGRYFRKGEMVGYVIGRVRPIARVVVGQDFVDLIRDAAGRVRVRRIDAPWIEIEGRVFREVPAGAEYLPSQALAAEGGGEIAIDPRDRQGPKAFQRVFQLDIELVGVETVSTFGQRALLQFELRPTPLGHQWYRRIRLLFLSVFDV